MAKTSAPEASESSNLLANDSGPTEMASKATPQGAPTSSPSSPEVPFVPRVLIDETTGALLQSRASQKVPFGSADVLPSRHVESVVQFSIPEESAPTNTRQEPLDSASTSEQPMSLSEHVEDVAQRLSQGRSAPPAGS